jgi:hypothetical protein
VLHHLRNCLEASHELFDGQLDVHGETLERHEAVKVDKGTEGQLLLGAACQVLETRGEELLELDTDDGVHKEPLEGLRVPFLERLICLLVGHLVHQLRRQQSVPRVELLPLLVPRRYVLL